MNIYEFLMFTNIFTIFLLSYFFGSIPFGVIVSKIAKIGDIRIMGSGNIGATNVYRVGGKKLGAITFLLDFFKCLIIPVILKFHFLDSITKNAENIILWCSFFSMLGHVFPVWLKFNGGKGVASLFALSFVFKFWIGAVLALFWYLIFKAFRYSSLASLSVAFINLLISILIFNHVDVIPVLFMTITVVLKHKDNISRLVSNTENKL